LLPHFVRTYMFVDNDATGTVVTGPWETGTWPLGYWGIDYLYIEEGTVDDEVTWNFDITRDGNYEIFARWASTQENASNASYIVQHDGGQAEVQRDQRVQGDEWVSLGSFPFTAGNSYSVTLGGEAEGRVVADSIRVEGPPHIVPDTE
jgi:hypothetical protein